MKFLTEYRDPKKVREIIAQISDILTQPWRIMEICGGQTHSIFRHGLHNLLPQGIQLIHGPGCPVCVTPARVIDQAISISLSYDVILCSYGDMLRVPGEGSDLLSAKAQGADIRVVYSPLDALRIANQAPEREVVFFGVGFETTAPGHALAILQAEKLGKKNISFLLCHVRVPPILAALFEDPEVQIEGVLAAGHVCTVMGMDEYEPLVATLKRPIVVTGFEPLDILQGILACIKQLEAGVAMVENCYGRAVQQGGNRRAKELLLKVFAIADQEWRGLGPIPASGFHLREQFERFDARRRFPITTFNETASSSLKKTGNRCRADLVLKGLLKPNQCPEFGRSCTPDTPLGATMVSAEGACAAYFNYRDNT